MKKLDSEYEIHKLAAGLKVDWQQNAVQNIIALCHDKISKWTKGISKIRSIQELEVLVCEKVKLVFEEIYSEDDLKAVIRKYVSLGEPIFSTLKTDLDEKTFATLIERRRIDGNSQDRYVAVIDCRGSKAPRRFFSRWHEIAHLLTLQGQLQLPLHRSTTDRSPTERLMDTIAGEIGFYDPLFRPILRDEIAKEGGFTFTTVERVRGRFCPEASFQATLNACVNRLDVPMLLVEIGLGYKKEEERQIFSSQTTLFSEAHPKPKLRVSTIIGNDRARGTSLKIHRNMQVPAASVLHRFFFKEDDLPAKELEGFENLNIWRHSDGGALANLSVRIRVRRFESSVIALISPARLT
jgi:hypothetical protein